MREMEKMHIADTITMDTKTGAIWIEDVELPWYTHEDKPTIELDTGCNYVEIKFLVDNIHILRDGEPISITRYEWPEPKCICGPIQLGWATGKWITPPVKEGCLVHDTIAYIRYIGAREKADALAWLTTHVDGIYDDLGLTREITV